MTPRTPQLRNARPAAPGGRRRRAFTMIELLISIAIVLVLMLGINQVFSIATDSIGAGQALSTVQRDNRSGHAVMYGDLKNAVLRGSPFFMIRSSRQAAFRNANERNGDLDYADANTLAQADNNIRTVDFDGDNVETATPRTAIDARNHRMDMLQFFARDIFRRQTGNDGVFTSNLASSEAYITYGHLNQPDDVGGFNTSGSKPPGTGQFGTPETAASNLNNFYAQQWILGRTAIVLREPELVGTDWVIYEEPSTPGTEQDYIGRDPGALDTSLSPLVQGSAATRNGNTFDMAALFQYSRFDLAGTSIRAYTDILETAIAAGRDDWYDDLNFRFSGWPTPTKPHTAFGTARAAPVFVPGCSQFIVEYAGDFTTQDFNTGGVTGAVPDGVTDFVYQNVGGFFARRVRWYGFPRNVDTTDDLPGAPVIRGATHPSAGPGGEGLLDVVPLRDVLIAAGAAEPAPFERNLDPSDSDLPIKDDYATATGVAMGAQYLVAWGPPGTFTDLSGAPVPDPPYPRMIRVLIGIDDVNGRLSDAQLYEYVIDLPQ